MVVHDKENYTYWTAKYKSKILKEICNYVSYTRNRYREVYCL